MSEKNRIREYIDIDEESDNGADYSDGESMIIEGQNVDTPDVTNDGSEDEEIDIDRDSDEEVYNARPERE
jgi:hypothetical protein